MPFNEAKQHANDRAATELADLIEAQEGQYKHAPALDKGYSFENGERVPVTQFDLTEVEARLNQVDPDQLAEVAAQMSVRVIRELLDYLFPKTAGGPANPNAIAVRAYALAWVINRQLLGDVSQADIAAMLDVTSVWFSRHCTEFSRRFGVYAAHQRSAQARANYTNATRLKWQKRKATEQAIVASTSPSEQPNNETRA